ncbi:hypothetical protein NMN56_042810, partial [Streptomyces iconiensis]|nr:hypothetical protein [Streptomyces iconiensis]
MTELTAAVPEVGTLHSLADHRAAREATAEPKVSLVKPPGTPEQERARDRVWVRGMRAARVAFSDERTRTAGRFVVRHSSYMLSGSGILARRVWDGRSAARYERMMRTAEAAGNPEEAREWEERGRAFRAARHQRRMDLLTAPQRLAKGAAVGVGATTGGLLVLGGVLALAESEPALIVGPFMAAVETIRWIVVIASVVWGAGKVVA